MSDDAPPPETAPKINWQAGLRIDAPDFAEWVRERVSTPEAFAAEYLQVWPCPITEDDLAEDDTTVWLVAAHPKLAPY